MTGEEMHQVAVGPIHAGIIEPGSFRFQCHGETVYHLEISLGYQHRGIERRLAWANVAAVAGLAVAFLRSVWLLARHRPAVVLSVGGYASAPCAVAAVVLRVPLVLAEQNAVPGAALRLVARFARASAVSFDGTPLPHAVVTGNPVPVSS